ncbi:contractile injection system protein, VgrG/Pvc8 family [Endozoicomonas acroporae]|uniref:contractile injection system protein, VgrG/Pvc8 family n=1 Tax=Endozoicomonas acroporae TaxID=1701104 RepID=UPI003D7AF40A
MIPAFKVTVEGEDITATLSPRLIALTLQDQAGSESDSVTITIDDTDNRVTLPEHGALLKVSLGYSGGLREFGTYTVDEVEVSGPPDTLRFTGRAADLRGNLKEPRSRSWHNITLAGLVQAIAAEHNMEPKVSERFTTETLKHIDQLNESDLNLLVRLAEQYDAVCKPVGNRLLFLERAQGKTVSGQQLPIISLYKPDLTSWSTTLPDRAVYQSVVASYTDAAGGNLVDVQAGQGKPAYRIKTPFPDEKQATEAAVGKLARLSRTERTLKIDLPGRPDLIAETPVVMEGFRSGIAGKWIVESATHTISKRGYTTAVELVPDLREVNE